MFVGQNLLLSILMGWTAIYQLFWGSLGARVLTNSHMLLSSIIILSSIISWIGGIESNEHRWITRILGVSPSLDPHPNHLPSLKDTIGAIARNATSPHRKNLYCQPAKSEFLLDLVYCRDPWCDFDTISVENHPKFHGLHDPFFSEITHQSKSHSKPDGGFFSDNPPAGFRKSPFLIGKFNGLPLL